MNTITRGTTHTDTFIIEEKLSNLESLYVTYMQEDSVIIEKTLEEVEETEDGKISVKLSQDDTLEFNATLEDGRTSKTLILIQVRYKTLNGEVYATKIEKARLENILKEGAI